MTKLMLRMALWLHTWSTWTRTQLYRLHIQCFLHCAKLHSGALGWLFMTSSGMVTGRTILPPTAGDSPSERWKVADWWQAHIAVHLLLGSTLLRTSQTRLQSQWEQLIFPNLGFRARVNSSNVLLLLSFVSWFGDIFLFKMLSLWGSWAFSHVPGEVFALSSLITWDLAVWVSWSCQNE